jgi:hypothetical protein
LAALPRLKSIQFGSTRITGLALEHLGKMRTLEEIEIDETWLSYEAGFRHLKNLPILKSVTLKDVVARESDIEKLKADHPQAKITWTSPDEKKLAKMNTEKAQRAGKKEKSKQ